MYFLSASRRLVEGFFLKLFINEKLMKDQISEQSKISDSSNDGGMKVNVTPKVPDGGFNDNSNS